MYILKFCVLRNDIGYVKAIAGDYGDSLLVILIIFDWLQSHTEC